MTELRPTTPDPPRATARLYDVDEVPVAIDETAWPICAAYDTDPPRPFDYDSAVNNGRPVATRREWRGLVNAARERVKAFLASGG